MIKGENRKMILVVVVLLEGMKPQLRSNNAMAKVQCCKAAG